MEELDDLAVRDRVTLAALEVELVVLRFGFGEDLEIHCIFATLLDRLECVHVGVIFLELLDHLVQLVGRLVLARRDDLEHAILGTEEGQ